MGSNGIIYPGTITKGRTMKQYPIWYIITACIYKSAKSYGVRNTGDVEVRVGTSSSNSHQFLRHTTTHRQHDNGDREYRFYVDSRCIRRALLKKGANELIQLDCTSNKI